ncbi:MAG: hypothetical protein KDD89_07285 [Anaerolineales bacterium]|nr:hypothetical protein [Anaerolineales bacterium]
MRMRKSSWQFVLGGCLALLLVLGLVGCGAQEPATETMDDTAVEEAQEATEAEAPAAETVPQDPEAIGSGEDDGSPFDPGAGPKVANTRTAGEGWVNATPLPPEDPARSTNSADGNDDLDTPLGQNQPLTLIVQDDNAGWLAYQDDLIAWQAVTGVAPLPTMPRHLLTLQNTAGQPLPGKTITLRRGTDPLTALRTHGDGTAVFYGGLWPEDTAALLTANDHPLPATTTSSQQQLVLANAQPPSAPLVVDLVILLDTAVLSPAVRENIAMALAYYENQPTEIDLRVTVVTAQGISSAIDTAVPSGSVAAGLAAVPTAVWSANSADRLLLWVTDNPPTEPNADQIANMQTLGVRVYPLLLTPPTAVQTIHSRQLAQLTGGQTLLRPATSGAAAQAAAEGRFALEPLNSWLIDTVRTAVGQ